MKYALNLDQFNSGNEVGVYDIGTLFLAFSSLIIETQGPWTAIFDCGLLLEKIGHRREIESRRFEHQPLVKWIRTFSSCFIF